MESQELPLWVRALYSTDGATANFEEWIDERIRYMERFGTVGSQSWEQTLGAKFAIGELEVLKTQVNFIPEEEARIQHGIVRTEGTGKRSRRRRKR